MGTRATIAKQTEKNAYIGRYIHFDGYPSGVGKGIINALEHFGLTKGKEVLLDEHPAGWSNIASCDWTQEIGYVESIDAPNRDRPMCYCHGDRNEEEWLIDSADSENDGWAEWVYVFNDSINSLMVYKKNYDSVQGIRVLELLSEVDLTNLSDAKAKMLEVDRVHGLSKGVTA